MKTKHISILMFILVFVAVALTGYPTAYAQDCNGGSCVTAGVWTVAAYVDKDTTVVLGDSWPIKEDDRLIFRYIIGATEKTSATSYVVFNLPEFPFLGSNPGGSAQDLDILFKDCGDVPISGIAYKINISATDKKYQVVDIYMPLGTCVNTEGASVWVKTNDTCSSSLSLWLPQDRDEGEVYPTDKEYNRCGTKVFVTFDPCFGFPTSVKNIDGAPCIKKDTAILCLDTNKDGVIDGNDVCENAPNFGPRIGGALLCTDSAPVYVYGDDMWFCPAPATE
jgi:hypothetical protein